MKTIEIFSAIKRKPGRIPMNIVYRIPWLNKRISDDKYLKFIYFCNFGKKLNLKNPKTFNEKMQWKKLNDRKEVYTTMVDKFKAKIYVSNIIGSEHIIKTYGSWSSFEEIPFYKLPNKFVLKCTHDSGCVVLCRDKSKLDLKKANKKLSNSLKRDFYLTGREWPYKNVKRRILAEELMENDDGMPLMDYKFYCFNGEPEYLYVSKGLENHNTAEISFYDMDFKRTNFYRKDFNQFKKDPSKPANFELMKEIARNLSKGFDFLRVDLYEIKGKIYFSELTFTPCTGLMPFEPEEYDLVLGEKVKI